MPLQVYRLRRLLAATAVLLTAIVAGMYFYARSKATDVLKSIPNKMGVDIKQTASGFQISKSDGKRTLFTVQASSVKQFKLNGNAELHNVNIILYGRDSSRFDQIYGENFAYNQKTGDVTATGEVQIDLVANSAGLASPDQATPKEIKNPIHLKTRDLVFNKDTGNAFTHARVEVVTPQASGWAMGVKYAEQDPNADTRVADPPVADWSPVCRRRGTEWRNYQRTAANCSRTILILPARMDPCPRIEQLFISTRTTTSSECLPKEMSALTRFARPQRAHLQSYGDEQRQRANRSTQGRTRLSSSSFPTRTCSAPPRSVAKCTLSKLARSRWLPTQGV